MINGDKKQKSRIYLAIFGVFMVLAALAAGQFVFIESADAGATPAGSSELAGGPENDSALGETLMEMMGKGTQDPDITLYLPIWLTCKVHMAGPGFEKVYLKLSCPSFTERWFKAHSKQEKEILAAGLTAISSNKKVLVCVSSPSQYSVIRACYVLN